MKLAERRNLIDSSGIRRIFDLAAKLKNPCNLSIGIPDFDVPVPVQDAAISAIRGGKNRYTVTAGIPKLREAILQRYAKQGLNFEDCIVTSGTSGGLFMLFLATLNPGDEVLIQDPYFVMYKHLLKFLGVKAVPVDTYPDFRLNRERLEAAVTPRTRMLIVNSPNNPTGIVYTAEEVKLAAEFAAKHDLLLVSDEIYDLFSFDGPAPSPAHHFKDTIMISGLSKTVAITGWRVGWICGPKDLVKALTEIQQYTFVCAPSIAQEAGLAALECDLSAQVDSYRARRDLIHAGLVNAGYEVQKPNGAFYIFPKAPDGDGDAFVERAIENELLMVPGSVFSERKSHFRISFAAEEKELRRGVSILEKMRGK